MREPVELNKPYTLFVDKADGTGFSKDYKTANEAMRDYNKNVRQINVDHVWIKVYAHSNDDGAVLIDWRKPEQPRERIHPSSMRELSMMIQLHGAERVRQAIDEIEQRLNRENKESNNGKRA